MEFCPDYEPNFEFPKRGLGRTGPKFQKLTKRKTIIQPKSRLHDKFFNYDDFASKDHTSLYSTRLMTPQFNR